MFPEMHTSGLGRTHPVTSLRFEEEEKVSTQSEQRRNRRAGRSLSVAFHRLSLLVFFLFIYFYAPETFGERHVQTARQG